MQTGQQVAITVACSCEMMLVPVRTVLFFLCLVFNNYVHGDYPYMPHSKWANISETGLQSVSGTVDLEGLLCQTCVSLSIVRNANTLRGVAISRGP